MSDYIFGNVIRVIKPRIETLIKLIFLTFNVEASDRLLLDQLHFHGLTSSCFLIRK